LSWIRASGGIDLADASLPSFRDPPGNSRETTHEYTVALDPSRPGSLVDGRIHRAKENQSLALKDSGWIGAVAISPDGKTIAAGLRYGGLKAWDVQSGKEKASLKAHSAETWSIAFSVSGKILVSGGGDWKQQSKVKLWDSASWKELGQRRHSGEVLAVAVSKEGKLAAGGWNGQIEVGTVDLLKE
jgi:WD40 repeat protein